MLFVALGFNPYKGFKPIATVASAVCAAGVLCFNPYKGFKPIATCGGGGTNQGGRFNPYKGFKPIATAEDVAI